MFHCQLIQYTGCNVKFVINMNRQSKRLTNRHRQSEQLFYLPQVFPSLPLGYFADDARLTFGELPQVYPGARGC